MSLFDVSKIEHGAQETARIANRAIDKLQRRLVSEIEFNLLADGLLRSQVQIFFQAHIRRVLEFIAGGYDSHLAGRQLVACSCARAVYETVACVIDFCEKLKPLVEARVLEDIAQFIVSRQFAVRIPDLIHREDGVDTTAVNILTQIDRLSKRVDQIRSEYDLLSERTHPNSLGALHHYWESGDQVIKFSSGSDDEPGLHALLSAGRLLPLMDEEMSSIEKHLEDHPFEEFPIPPFGLSPMSTFDPSRPALLFDLNKKAYFRWGGRHEEHFRRTAVRSDGGNLVQWKGRVLIGWRRP